MPLVFHIPRVQGDASPYKVEVGAMFSARSRGAAIQRQPSGPGFLTLFVRHLIVVAWRHLNIHLFSALYEDTVELVVIKQQNLISFFLIPYLERELKAGTKS